MNSMKQKQRKKKQSTKNTSKKRRSMKRMHASKDTSATTQRYREHRGHSKKAERAEHLPIQKKRGVWALLERSGDWDLGFQEIVRELDLTQEETRQLRQFLKAQVRLGRIENPRRGWFRLPSSHFQRRKGSKKSRSKPSSPWAFSDPEERLSDEPFECERLAELDVESFPLGVIEEAERVAHVPTFEECKGRLDLRTIPLVTIDGLYAKDFDDAVGIYKYDDKSIQVVVAIADVAHYVTEGSMLDDEAARRATSVYLPGTCYPMLPESLSNGVCSLRPNEERLCMAALLTYTKQGQLVDCSLHEAMMCSRARLTYTQVGALLALEEEEAEAQKDSLHPDVWEHRSALRTLHEYAQFLRRKRFARGALELEIPEPGFVFDEAGKVQDIQLAERNNAHFLIEEWMLQANEAVASFLIKHGIPGVFRNHGMPSQEKLGQLLEAMRHMISTAELEQAGISLSTNITEEEITPQYFASLLNALGVDHPARPLFQQMLLRCMQQAVYSDVNEGHFGLALNNYVHFTSPIRRYPDLCVHRALKHYLRGTLTAQVKESLMRDFEEMAEHSSVRERMAMKAERAAISRTQAEWMLAFIGEEREGVIASVTPFGFFVRLDDCFVEGLIHVRQLRGHYVFNELDMTLASPRTGERFALGDRLRIRIEHASPIRGQVNFSLVARVQISSKNESLSD